MYIFIFVQFLMTFHLIILNIFINNILTALYSISLRILKEFYKAYINFNNRMTCKRITGDVRHRLLSLPRRKLDTLRLMTRKLEMFAKYRINTRSCHNTATLQNTYRSKNSGTRIQPSQIHKDSSKLWNIAWNSLHACTVVFFLKQFIWGRLTRVLEFSPSSTPATAEKLMKAKCHARYLVFRRHFRPKR